MEAPKVVTKMKLVDIDQIKSPQDIGKSGEGIDIGDGFILVNHQGIMYSLYDTKSKTIIVLDTRRKDRKLSDIVEQKVRSVKRLQITSSAPKNNFSTKVASKYKITASDRNTIINEVAHLSTETLNTLLKKEGLDIGHIRHVDKIHQMFIKFVVGALDSAPNAYKNWMDAWKYFVDSYNLDTLKANRPC